MVPSPLDWARRPTLRTALAWVLSCALLSSGCANCRLPRIDPTGERLFVFGDTPTPSLASAPPYQPGVIPAGPGGAPVLGPTPAPTLTDVPPLATGGALGHTPGLSLSPSQVVAPIGSEVVMIATVMGDHGYPLTREKIEWMIGPDGPGTIVSPGERRPFEILDCLHHLPRKVSGTYAINTTLTRATTLNRGTPTAADDIRVGDGQSWISVTSGAEGTTHVTAFAPKVDGWDRRQQSASIYWVDAQWRFPAPGITPAGGRNSLVTVVTRQSDGAPLAGWVVRYEITGGPEASFAPSGTRAVEIITASNGEAPAEISQAAPSPGTNAINIQVIRPPSPGDASRSVPIGSGTTTQTWTTGDATIPYNPPPTTPPFTPVPTVPAQPAPVQPSPFTPAPTTPAQPFTPVPTPVPFEPTPQTPAQPPLQPEPSAAVPAGEPKLEVAINGPTTATVGTDAQFEIQVKNVGTASAQGLRVTDRFDEGLEHASATASRAIKQSLTDLHPGETTRVAVAFRISKPGQLCQEVTVTALGQADTITKSCITAVEGPLAAEPAPITPIPAEPTPAEPTPAEPTPTPAEPPAATPGTARVTVTKSGPDRRQVGETSLFVIEVTNNGSQAIANIEIADNYEISLEPTRATSGSEWLAGNALGWKIPSLEPGQTVRREIEMRCLRETPKACNRVMVTAPGMEAVADEACVEIVAGEAEQPAAPAQGASQIKVSVAETADPIRINGQTTYQIILTNSGEASAFDVVLNVTFGEQLQILSHSGPLKGTTGEGSIRFPEIRELRAGESQTFELRFKGLAAGTGRVQVQVNASGLAKPVTADQTTEILP